MSNQPNIVFIFTDQQSAAMMSCAGNRYVDTPAMDNIAENGIRFERAYSMNPMCVPSRFSLLTGRRGSDIGLLNNNDKSIDAIPDDIKQNGMGWLLREAGYTTAYGGKVHLPKGLTPEDLGFETISTDERDKLADDCVDFLNQSHDKPFMLVAAFINPHDICHIAIRDFAETDLEKSLSHPDRIELQEVDEALKLPDDMSREEFLATVCPPLPDNFEIQKDEPEAISKMQARSPFKRKSRAHYTDEQWRMHRWAYARLTERVDEQIERVLNAIDANGLAENTLIVFSSDHGDMDASHRMEHKTAFYDEAARIPLLISGAGVNPQGVVDTRLTSNGLDLLPTFCDFAGIEPPEKLEGLSLRPLLEGRADTDWREVLPVESEMGQMIISGQYKYMMHYDGKHREQLIDLLTDPGEMRNAINDPQQQPMLSELRQKFMHVFPTAINPHS